MQFKYYNSYRITHKNGEVEEVNAENLVQALENASIPESTSKVIQTYMTKENIRTLVQDEPTEVMFTSVVADALSGAIATPSSGKIHVGDELAFKAIPARNYSFVSWKRNNVVISTDASFVYTMEALGEGEDTAVFTATFELAPVEWTSEVSPAEATGVGCVAFPEEGTTEANEELQLIAVEAGTYTFSHWERNGVQVGTNKILTVEATPLAEGEDEAVYVAVFNQ